MKNQIQKLGLVLVFALLFTNFLHAHNEEKGITFFKGTWKEVLAKAKKENKLIFIDAYATWCGPCKLMAKKVFTVEKVAKYYNEKFIPYKIDVEKGEGPEIFKKYGGTAMPTFFFVDSDEKLVFKKVGSMSADAFIQAGKDALVMPEMVNKFKKGDRSTEFIVKYANKMANPQDKELSNIVDEYFKKLKNEDLTKKENFELMLNYPRAIDSKEFKYYVKNHKKFADKLGKDMILAPLESVLQTSFKEAVEKKDKKPLDNVMVIIQEFEPYFSKGATFEKIKESIYSNYEKAIQQK